MRFGVVVGVLAVCAMIVVGCSTEPYAQRARVVDAMGDTLTLMTNQDVIVMAKAGIGDDVIIGMMKLAGSQFRLRTQDVVALADSGISDKVISAMISSSRSAEYRDRGGVLYSYPMSVWYDGYMSWYPWYPGFYFDFAYPYFGAVYSYHSGWRGYWGHAGAFTGRGSYGIRPGGRHR